MLIALIAMQPGLESQIREFLTRFSMASHELWRRCGSSECGHIPLTNTLTEIDSVRYQAFLFHEACDIFTEHRQVAVELDADSIYVQSAAAAGSTLLGNGGNDTIRLAKLSTQVRQPSRSRWRRQRSVYILSANYGGGGLSILGGGGADTIEVAGSVLSHPSKLVRTQTLFLSLAELLLSTSACPRALTPC